MASLQIDGSHLCGGFLIRKDFILTSAHCSHRCKEIKVVLGAHNIRRKEALIQKIPVKKCYKHNLYKIAIYDYDIMLIKLQHNAALNKNVKVIELPKYKETVPDETQCTMSGWGKTTPQGQFESVLQEVSLKIQSNKECRTAWHNVFSPQRTLCTHFNGKKGICQGDSGGPLVCKNKAHGIAAFTGNPCNMNYPNVFMKVRLEEDELVVLKEGAGVSMADLPRVTGDVTRVSQLAGALSCNDRSTQAEFTAVLQCHRYRYEFYIQQKLRQIICPMVTSAYRRPAYPAWQYDVSSASHCLLLCGRGCGTGSSVRGYVNMPYWCHHDRKDWQMSSPHAIFDLVSKILS
ncbi:granzyme B-like, partial [Scleropages formosus]